MLNQYFQEIKELLNSVESNEKESMIKAAQEIATCIQQNGIVHVFGCGHSHILAEELFYRAGGLAPINPILIEDLMLHKGAVRSSQLERQNDLAYQYLEKVKIQSNDILIVASTSGRNPFPIDVAEFARQKGAFVIAITSLNYREKVTSRHKNGMYLADSADLIIDNHIKVGDALINNEQLDISFGSGSTVVGTAIINSIMVEVVTIMCQNKFVPPIFKSGNVDGAEEYNKQLINKYKSRIPLLETNL